MQKQKQQHKEIIQYESEYEEDILTPPNSPQPEPPNIPMVPLKRQTTFCEYSSESDYDEPFVEPSEDDS